MNIIISSFCALLIIFPILLAFLVICIIISYFGHRSNRERCKWKSCKFDDIFDIKNLLDIEYVVTYSDEEYYKLSFKNNLKLECYIGCIYVLDDKSKIGYSVILSFKDYLKYYYFHKVIFRRVKKSISISKNQIKED